MVGVAGAVGAADVAGGADVVGLTDAGVGGTMTVTVAVCAATAATNRSIAVETADRAVETMLSMGCRANEWVGCRVKPAQRRIISTRK
jgi:hypothetical protein